MIGKGSTPVSAMRPAKTETTAGTLGLNAAEALPSLARGDESLAWAGDSGFTKQLHVSICEKSRTLDNLDPFLVSR
jgi:hypothetical protein